MNTTFKPVSSSHITISELMLPSHTNFSGKIHGGYILSQWIRLHLLVVLNFAEIIVLQPQLQ
jgi:acyl-CoA hydrolase